MHHQHSRSRTRGRRLARIVISAAISAAPLGLLASSADAAVPGDRQSPVVVERAAEALDVLEAPQLSGIRAAQRADSFEALLADAAAATAREVGVNEREMQLAWLAADRPHQVALLSALTQLGAPYRSISSDPDAGFDCSGLTSWSWAQAGVELPRSSGDQIGAAAGRQPETAMAGDLVQYPGHVMLSLGVPGAVVHASNPETDVELWVSSEGRSLRYGNPIAND
jgi:hypothetical protein